MNKKGIHICVIYRVISFFILFLTCTPFQVTSQDLGNEEVKRLQRTIFIYNFTQQVSWPNIEEQKSFKIGVLGPDRTVLDLQVMASTRKIYGKPIEIIRFQLVKDVKDVQLLYVNNKFNYDVHYILNKISGKKILLISEDYNFNASMINMVNVGNSFEYEINTNHIEREGFVILPSLKRYAISSSQKWKRLYQSTEKILDKVQEENEEKKVTIKVKDQYIDDQNKKINKQTNRIGDQEKEINDKEGEIRERNEKIEHLYSESQLQQKKYSEKLQIERELEKNIQEQIVFIKEQEEKIQASAKEINEQQEFLETQNKQIKKQEKVLEEQTTEINAQKKINILLISLVVLILGGSFFIYRSYLMKKRLSKELEAQHQAIYKQSLELESKNKELEQFAYIASHDLQEPLNTISSFIGLIADDYGDSFDDVGIESLKFIQDASVRMKKLIDSLLQYSRLGREKEYIDVDCNEILKELKGDLKNIIENTGTEIYTENLPIITGSEIELRLLFQNLISNGIKFTNKETRPKIDILSSLNESTGFWEFSVKDNGIGIPKEHQERIFAIFQRLHSRDQFEGTGIGLAHCKKIVESHGGRIWLDSEEGKGTIFYFTIPVQEK